MCRWLTCFLPLLLISSLSFSQDRCETFSPRCRQYARVFFSNPANRRAFIGAARDYSAQHQPRSPGQHLAVTRHYTGSDYSRYCFSHRQDWIRRGRRGAGLENDRRRNELGATGPARCCKRLLLRRRCDHDEEGHHLRLLRWFGRRLRRFPLDGRRRQHLEQRHEYRSGVVAASPVREETEWPHVDLGPGRGRS